MFSRFDVACIFAISGRLPLRVSVLDGLPVLGSIYMLDTMFMPPAAQWTPVFHSESVPSLSGLVQIQACTTAYNPQMDQGAENSRVVLCSMTNTSGYLSVFQLDLALGRFAFSMYWSEGWNVSVARSRFVTEVVPVPQNGDGNGMPDVVVGAPIAGDSSYATVLCISAASRAARPLPGARGLGSYKSMVFAADGQSLFAVDEQPAIWRWDLPFFGLSEGPSHVARYVHPVADSVWKIMVWSNSRLVLATDYSVNLWTQCSPCPSGTVTASANSSEGISTRCLCPSGTFNNLLDFRSTCTACTKAGQVRTAMPTIIDVPLHLSVTVLPSWCWFAAPKRFLVPRFSCTSMDTKKYWLRAVTMTSIIVGIAVLYPSWIGNWKFSSIC